MKINININFLYMKYYFFTISFICLLLHSCTLKSDENKEWEDYAKNEVLNWIGKEVYIPDSMLVMMGDSSEVFYLSKIDAKKRIVTYIDISCEACLNNFSFWNKFIHESEQKNIECQYLIHINGNQKSLPAIRKLGFHHPVLLDSNSIFIEKNDLWDKRFQTALLNEKNEVVLIGDPTVNERLKELYMNVLLSDEN